MSPFLIGAALVVAAPALKDSPPKAPTVVGRWEASQVVVGGKDIGQARGLEYQFGPAGEWVIYRDGKPLDGPRSYTTDPKAKPPVVDLSENNTTYPGVFQVEGDTLTLLFRTDKMGARPAAFDDASDGLMKVVMKRRKED